jgi:hypothetical protein
MSNLFLAPSFTIARPKRMMVHCGDSMRPTMAIPNQSNQRKNFLERLDSITCICDNPIGNCKKKTTKRCEKDLVMNTKALAKAFFSLMLLRHNPCEIDFQYNAINLEHRSTSLLT